MECSPPGSSVHGILQARILERVAVSSLRGSSRPRDQTCISYVSCMDRQVFFCFLFFVFFFTTSATWVVMYGCESWTVKKAEDLMLLNYGVGEDS